MNRLNEEFQQLCFKEVILTEKSEVQVYANEMKGKAKAFLFFVLVIF